MTVSTIKYANELIPEQFAQMIIPRNTTAVGFLMIDGDDLNVTSTLGELSYDTMLTFQMEDKDKLMVFHLSDETLKEEDIPPFKIEKDNNPLIVGFLYGKFENYKEVDLAHTPARNCFDSHLRPMILGIMNMKDGDVDKTMKELDSAAYRMNIMNMMSDGDHVIVVAHTGDVLKYSKKAPFKDFSWGSTSDTYGYEEKAESKPQSDVMAKLKASILAKRSAGKKQEPTEEEAEVEVKETKETALPDGVHRIAPASKKTEPPKLFKSTGKKADGTTMSKTEIEQEYVEKAGWLPPKAYKRPEVRIMISETALEAALKKAEEVKEQKLAKDIPDIPLMSEETIKKVKHFINEINKSTKDPAKAGSEEQDYPDFSEAIGPTGGKLVLGMLDWRYDQWHNWIKAIGTSVGLQPIAILISELSYNILTLRGPVEDSDKEEPSAKSL